MGRPFPTPWVKGPAEVSPLEDMEVILDDYVISLIDKLNSVCADVSLSLPIPSDKSNHNLIPGQQVLIRSLKPVTVGEPRHLGPAVVIVVTRTGVLTDHQPQWIHASRLKHLSTYAPPIDTVGPKKPAQSVWLGTGERACTRQKILTLLVSEGVTCGLNIGPGQTFAPLIVSRSPLKVSVLHISV